MRKGTVSILLTWVLISSATMGLLIVRPVEGFDEIGIPDPIDNPPVSDYSDSHKGHFTRNDGQWSSGYEYVGSSDMGYVGMNRDGIYFDIIKEVIENEEPEPPTHIGHVLKFSFDGANYLRPDGREEMVTKYHYLIGEEVNWVRHVPNFEEVWYPNVWDGIDISYRFGESGGVKYDIILSPGSSPLDVRITLDGHKNLEVIDDSLVIDVDGEVVIEDSGLDVFYLDDPMEKIDAAFKLVDGNTYSFELEDYDETRTVVIDPLYYSTYIGGYGTEYGYGIGVDSNGQAMVSGYSTYSSSGEFPTTSGAYQSSRGSTSYDAYVSKFDYTGSALIYSTFIGGYNSDYCYAGTADRSGYAYICGYTYYYGSSNNYPSTSGAYQTGFTYTGYPDTFVTKLSKDGSSLEYSTFIGGGYYDYCRAIDVDSSGYVYISGYCSYSSTYSVSYGDYPTTVGAFQTTRGGTSQDAFATKFNPSGSAIIWSTFIGGSISSEYGYGIAADTSGNAYATGYTGSSDFPTTSGAYDTSLSGSYSTYVTKLASSNGAGVYSTYLGGGGYDYGRCIDVDSSGYAYVSGYTSSGYSSTYMPAFPTTTGAYSTTHNGGTYDLFVTKMNTAGTGLVYSTFLGGSSSDYAGYRSIKVGSNGNAYVTGYTSSSNFPVTSDAYDSTYSSTDSFLVNLSSSGSSLGYSTYVGGTSSDYGYSLALDQQNIAYVSGYTSSSNFPTTSGCYQSTYRSTEAYVFKVGGDFADDTAPTLTDQTVKNGETGSPFTFKATASDNVGVTEVHAEYWSGTGSHTNVSFYPTGISFDRTITLPNSVNTFYYFLSATDYKGNWVKTTTQSFVPIDGTGPKFSNVAVDTVPTTGGTVNVTVVVSDNVAYVGSTVKMYFRDTRNPSYTSVPMKLASGDTFYYVGSIANDWTRVYLYFTALDTSNNLGTSSTYYMDVLDNISPTFVSEDCDTTASTGDPFNFSVTMNDNIGIGYASVEYWFGTGSHTIRSLSISGAGYGSDQTGTATITIPSNTVTMYYFYNFRDLDMNYWASGPSSTVTIAVSDNDAPRITSIGQSSATTGESYQFSIGFDDNIDGPAITSASLEWTYNSDWDNSNTWTLTYNSAEEVWESSSFTVRSNSIDPITFKVSGTDSSSNVIRGDGYSIHVIDNDDPVFNADNTGSSGTTGDPHNFTVNVGDNVGIGMVHLNVEYRGGMSYSEIPLMDGGSGIYYINYELAHTLSPLDYYFIVYDTSGNSVTSSSGTVTISDNDPPDIYSDMTKKVAKAGEKKFPIKVMISDNIELASVSLDYWFSFAPAVQTVTPGTLSGNIYLHLVDLPPESGTLSYKFRATDTPAGLVWETQEKVVELLDTTLPEISDPIYEENAYTGNSFQIATTVTDDIEVDSVRLYYGFGGDTPVPMDGVPSGDTYTFSLMVPDSLDPLYFWIEAQDPNSNTGMTEVFMVPVMDDDLPVFEEDLSDTETTTGDMVMLKLNATDNIGVDHVDLSVMLPGGEWETHTMMSEGKTYHMEMTAPNDMTGLILYYFTIYDTSMNMVTTDEEDVNIVDDEEPVAFISGPASAFQFEQVTFSAVGSTDNVGITSFIWEINEEEFTGAEINHTFDTVGVYSIDLKVWDGVNPPVSQSHDITIRDAEDPEILVEVPEEMGNHETLWVNASYPHTMDNVGILTYTWRLVLPDTTRISASGEFFEYDLTGILGTIALYLTVADAEGNSDDAEYSIEVVDNLAPTIVVPEDLEVFVGTFVQFEDEESTDNVGIFRWVWHLTSDGIEDIKDDNIDSYSYYFQEAGVYNITLTLYDSNNNSASDWFHVLVQDRGTNLDTDDDDMPDEWEDRMGLDKEVDDSRRDYDNDLLINLKEYELGTNPKSADSDGDGMPDQWEYKYAFDEGYTDLNDDGVPQWMAMFTADGDIDEDGDSNLEEYLEGGRDPTVKDAEEEAEDDTVLYVVILVVLIILGLIIVLVAIVVFGKVKPVEDEFPESQYPHLYRKEGSP